VGEPRVRIGAIRRATQSQQRFREAKMTELEKVEREIATLQENVRSSTRALRDTNLSEDAANRERSSIELYQRHLDELLMKRDGLQFLAED
jgi:Na+/phosphate symporter